MEFSEQKKESKKFLKIGDLTEVANLSGGVTLQTVRNMFRKNSLMEMTDAQLECWKNTLKIVEKRKLEMKDLSDNSQKILEL